MVLSGFLNAAKIASAAAGTPLADQRILFLGAGSAGVGVAMQLQSFFTLNGMSEEEARRRVWFVDSQGLIYDSRGPMAEHKKCKSNIFACEEPYVKDDCSIDFSRPDYTGPPMKDLLSIIDYVKPTALLGLSTLSVSTQMFYPDS